jgi:hypothetical protein
MRVASSNPPQRGLKLEGSEMRLIPRHRHHQRSKAPTISITQAEITADLVYPASARALRVGAETRGRGGAR